ncbi:beta/gamma crystallin domain-containing protein [Kitasatospora brasiliensis]|uniref:beta/gamma crystallin domain-containing protein n=1 Tax=Kitasatospora brasiliensis TaxID=3058040 RepID=UPI00292FCC75|nr:beta/gamma crystallin domain-containing protein [Kitasatospora sp. K002]
MRGRVPPPPRGRGRFHAIHRPARHPGPVRGDPFSSALPAPPANGGRTSFGSWWVDRISTGNNDLIYYDVNGDSVKIPRWTDITDPNRPSQVKDIEIL